MIVLTDMSSKELKFNYYSKEVKNVNAFFNVKDTTNVKKMMVIITFWNLKGELRLRQERNSKNQTR